MFLALRVLRTFFQALKGRASFLFTARSGFVNDLIV